MADKILNVPLTAGSHRVLKKRAKDRGTSKRFIAREILELNLREENEAHPAPKPPTQK